MEKKNLTSKGSRRAGLKPLPCQCRPFATRSSSLGATMVATVCCLLDVSRWIGGGCVVYL
jgi:hypothetical protein